jgi:hypothetical protein
MIFLAVSSALMVSAFTLISGSQNKASFTQGINDVQQQINIVINNVSNGYYSETAASQGCNVNPSTGELEFTPTGAKGTSSQCIFLGRVIVFKNGENTFTVYNVAGRRQVNNREVSSMREAKPTLIPESEQVFQLKNGVTFKGSGPNAFGFFNGLASTVGVSDQLNSGYQQASFYGFSFSNELPGDFSEKYDDEKDPTNGYPLCFDSGTTNQSGIITIGGSSRSATSSLEIKGEPCPSS